MEVFDLFLRLAGQLELWKCVAHFQVMVKPRCSSFLFLVGLLAAGGGVRHV